jgi:SAM-dependent methyltransferase
VSCCVASTSELVRKYYRQYDEWRRLVKDPYHKLEYETTLHFLRRYLPPRGLLLDAGGGPGRYTIELAKMGYDVVLLDLTPKHLDIARTEIRRARVEDKVRGIHRGSIQDLSRFRSGTFDAVLCLGTTLGHVVDRIERGKALGELARVAKKGAPIFVSVVGRYAQFMDPAGRFPEKLDSEPKFYFEALKTGDYDGSHGFAPCHFFFPEELEGELNKKHLQVVERVGLEGLASYHCREVNRLARTRPNAWSAWKRIHLRTCTQPAVVGTSEHFMLVCRKPGAARAQR